MYMCEFFETCMLLDKLRSSKFGVLLDLFSFSFAYEVFGCEIRCRLARSYFCQYFQIYFLSIRIQKITIDGVFALGICAQG